MVLLVRASACQNSRMSFPLRDTDLRHLWHPYTDATTFEREPYLCIDSAEGVYLFEDGGGELLDGISSWWCVSLGHGHPRIVEAIREQAGDLQHSILGNMSHPRAIQLAERLSQIAPGDLNRVYFASDGSSATEAALKMAVQYWRNVGQPERTRFVSLEQAYHGDTLGAMGAGFVEWFHEPFEHVVRPALRAPSPHYPGNDPEAEARHCDDAFAAMEQLLRAQAKEIAAVIIEPRVQGAAGIWIYPADYLRRLRALCDELDILIIADEIAVGFARTGKMFACETAGIVPDFLCLGKALTGGYLPMSATIARDKIYDAFRGEGDDKRVFWDGHTFCGNPITAAAAIAALDVFAELDLPASCAPHEARIADAFTAVGAMDSVAYQKTLGMIGMCAIREDAGGAPLAREITLAARERGLFLRPLGTSLYLWPPLTATTPELDRMLNIFHESIEACTPAAVAK